MRTLTDRQRAVRRYLSLDPDMPLTVREIAQALHRPESTIRTDLKALERNGDVEQRGVALTGGRTWGPVQRVVS